MTQKCPRVCSWHGFVLNYVNSNHETKATFPFDPKLVIKASIVSSTYAVYRLLTYTWCQRRDRELQDAPLVRTPAPRRLWVCVSAPLMAAVTSGQRHSTWTLMLRGSATFRRGCGLASGAEAPWEESFPLLVFQRMVPSRLPTRLPSNTVTAVARLPSLQVDPLGGELALPAELVMVVTAVWAVRGNFMWHDGNVVLLGESAVFRCAATVDHGILRRRRDRMPRTAQVDCPPSLVPWEG